jgi:hypothetical protein
VTAKTFRNKGSRPFVFNFIFMANSCGLTMIRCAIATDSFANLCNDMAGGRVIRRPIICSSFNKNLALGVGGGVSFAVGLQPHPAIIITVTINHCFRISIAARLTAMVDS